MYKCKMWEILNALMVKRLRRRPLTAESGVRFPMGVPQKQVQLGLVSILPRWGIAHSVCATVLHEPQNTGVAFRLVCKHTHYTITFTSFSTIPILGVPKKHSTWVFFHFSFFICPMGNGTLCVRNCVARTPEHWRSMRLNKQDYCTDYVFCCFQVEVWQLLIQNPTNSWKIVILFCFYAWILVG